MKKLIVILILALVTNLTFAQEWQFEENADSTGVFYDAYVIGTDSVFTVFYKFRGQVYMCFQKLPKNTESNLKIVFPGDPAGIQTFQAKNVDDGELLLRNSDQNKLINKFIKYDTMSLRVYDDSDSLDYSFSLKDFIYAYAKLIKINKSYE